MARIKLRVPLPEGARGATVDVTDARALALTARRLATLIDEPTPAPVEATEVEDDRPAGNASEGEWRAYRLAHGYTDDELVDEAGEPLGRNALRDLPDRNV